VLTLAAAEAACAAEIRVTKPPSWLRSWANLGLLSLHSHRNAWADLHMLGAGLTPPPARSATRSRSSPTRAARRPRSRRRSG
jgi:hypothetical protein